MTTRLLKVMMTDEARRAAFNMLGAEWIGCGAVATAFEAALAERLFLGSRPLATCSGTAALELACELFVPRGSVVISTPVTFAATSTAIARAGALIAWADVDPRTGLICPESVAQLVRRFGDSVSAIVAVDWCGQRAPVLELRQAAPHAAVIEDAAQAFGVIRASADLPDAICYSFQATKHVTTVDGGALWVQPWTMPRARSLAYFGLDTGRTTNPERRMMRVEPGSKRHLDDVRAAIGIENLRAEPRWQARREEIAQRYDVEREDDQGGRASQGLSRLWVYAARVKDVALARVAFREADVDVSQIHVRNDWHPGLRKCMVNEMSDRPGVAEFYRHFLAVPCGPWLDDVEVERVANVLREVSL